MRPLRLLPILVIGGAMLPMAAPAKEGVRAKLDEPVRLNTTPGRQIRVLWRLVDGHGRAFGASGIYLRVSRCTGRPLTIRASHRARGRYSVRLTVPKGGIRKLLVGLKGWRIIGNRRERADAYFQFNPPVYRDCT